MVTNKYVKTVHDTAGPVSVDVLFHVAVSFFCAKTSTIGYIQAIHKGLNVCVEL